MQSRWVVCFAATVVACQSRDNTASSAAKPAAAGAGSAVVDPWDTPRPTSADQAPSLFERHARADKVCPRVVKPYFYRVDKAGHTAYLLGTRHLGVGLDKLPAVVRDRFKAATLAVFETAPDDTSGERPGAFDLRAALGDADWHRLEALAGKDAAAGLAHMAPSAAALLIMARYEDMTATLDLELEGVAADAHIPTRGLETSAFQDALIVQLLDIRALRAELEQTKDRAELESDSADDLAKYCAGTDDNPGTDAKERGKMLAAGYSAREIDDIDELMVYKRNASWIPKLEQVFRDGTPFIVVGCDHLKGPRGVVALLRARGYTLTRLGAEDAPKAPWSQAAP